MNELKLTALTNFTAMDHFEGAEDEVPSWKQELEYLLDNISDSMKASEIASIK